jgi:hypothetical protein
MRRLISAPFLLGLVLGCGDGEDDETEDDARMPSQPSASQPDDTASRCQRGCEATLEAACPNGPPTQTACEADCDALASGPCAAEYEALASCADGEAITCDASGIPAIPACSEEQSTMVACLQSAG